MIDRLSHKVGGRAFQEAVGGCAWSGKPSMGALHEPVKWGGETVANTQLEAL